MFAFATQNESMKIGQRNAEATRAILADFRIPIIAEDTGNYGRPLSFHLKMDR